MQVSPIKVEEALRSKLSAAINELEQKLAVVVSDYGTDRIKPLLTDFRVKVDGILDHVLHERVITDFRVKVDGILDHVLHERIV